MHSTLDRVSLANVSSLGYPFYSLKSSDIQSLFRRIEQLEEAFSGTETAQERDVPNHEEPTIPVSSKVQSPRKSARLSTRDSTIFSEGCSTSPATSPQVSTSSYGYSLRDDSRDGTTPVSQLGPNWFFNGVPISSEGGRQWISTRTDQATEWIDFSIPIKVSASFSTIQSLISQDMLELPEKNSTRETMSAFFKSSSRLIFPVLDEILFETTMETAYEPIDKTMLSPNQIAARACVFSALSIASRLDLSSQMPVSIDADICASKAHHLLMYTTEHVSLATAQAAIILVS